MNLSDDSSSRSNHENDEIEQSDDSMSEDQYKPQNNKYISKPFQYKNKNEVIDQSDDSVFEKNLKNKVLHDQENIEFNFLQSPIMQPQRLQDSSPNFLEGSYLQGPQDPIDDFKLEANSQKEEEQQSHEEMNSFNVSRSMKSFSIKNNQKMIDNLEESTLDFKEKKAESINIDQQNEYNVKFQDDNIKVTHSRVEKQIKVTHYFKIIGSILIEKENRQFETEKRFSDFLMLNKILQNKYYYIVLPQLPEKNVSILVTSNIEQLKQRVDDLNYYLNKMIDIEDISNDNLFQIFLLQNDQFQNNVIANQEYDMYCSNDKQILSSFLKSAQIWKKQLTNQNQIQLGEPYRLLVKKIISQIAYIKSVVENFVIIQKNFNRMLDKIINIYSDCQEEDVIEALEKNKKYRKQNQQLKKTILKYKNLLKDSKSCKKAVEKRQEILAQSQHNKEQMENEIKNAQRLVQLQIQNEKYELMVQNIEKFLLKDLTQKQQMIQDELKTLSQSNIKQSFKTFFSFNQFKFNDIFKKRIDLFIYQNSLTLYINYIKNQAKLITDLDVFSIKTSSISLTQSFLLHIYQAITPIIIKITIKSIIQKISFSYNSCNLTSLKFTEKSQSILRVSQSQYSQNYDFTNFEISDYYSQILFKNIYKYIKILNKNQQMIQILAKPKFGKKQSQKTLPVSIDITISDLKKIIQMNFGILQSFQKLTIKQQNYTIRLVESFKLGFYQVQNNQEIFIDVIQDPKSHFKTSFDIKNATSMYDSSFIQQTLRLYRKKQQQVWNSIYAHNFILSLNKEYRISKQTSLYDISKQYFQICKKENMKNIDVLLNKIKNLNQDDLEKIINQRDSLGWPGILYAIRNQQNLFIIQICKISKGKIFDCQSHDGWTVISYSIFQNNWNLLMSILKFAKYKQVQIETSRGSLPHYLIKYSPKIVILETLFNKLIDPRQIDSSLQKALDVCCKDKKEFVIKIMQIIDVPFMPFGIIDEVQKNYFFRGWKNQYVKFDFDTFSMQIFNTLQDIPFVMKRIIPIQLLNDIQFLKYNNQNETFQYFKFTFDNKKHEYRIKSERVQIWQEVLKRFQFFHSYYNKYIIKKNFEYQNYIKKYWKKINKQCQIYDLHDDIQFNKIYSILFAKKLEQIKNFPVKISDFYYIQKLGSGAFANVFQVVHKKSGKVLALKTINKNNLLKTKTKRFALIEKQILQENQQESFLITLHFAFQNDQFLYIAEDYCHNGDIETLLNQQPERSLPIDVVRIYAAQILLALQELHERNYIYRDLKPENILIDDQGYIKITDFGLCAQNIKQNSQYSTTFCGTPYYLPPEMIKYKQSYKASDFFSLGVLIYEFIRGIPPFTGMSQSEIYQKIKNKNIQVENEWFDNDSADLITRLTNKDPQNRLGYENIQEIFEHEFFRSIDWDKLKKKLLPPPVHFEKAEITDYDYKNQRIKNKTLSDNSAFDQKRYFDGFDYINPIYLEYYKQINQFYAQIKKIKFLFKVYVFYECFNLQVVDIFLNQQIQNFMFKNKQNYSQKQMTNIQYFQSKIIQAQIKMIGYISVQQMVEDIVQKSNLLKNKSYLTIQNQTDLGVKLRQFLYNDLQTVFYVFEIRMGDKYWKFLQQTKQLAQQYNIQNFFTPDCSVENQQTIQQITQCFQSILKQGQFFQDLNFLYEFFEVSLLNFIITTDEKFYKQCFVEKKSEKLEIFLSILIRSYQNRWFLVTSEGIAYVKVKEFFDKKMREYCFYKGYLKIYFKRAIRIDITFRGRQFQLKFGHQEQMIDFFYSVILSFQDNIEEEQYRFGSFSPICQNNSAKFYINGFTQPDYFSDLCDVLLKAKKSVLITDWWLSPEIYLKRPMEQHPYSKLETVLHQVAKKGIKVLILIYKESPKVLANDSQHTKDRLQSLHKNILVVRHPYNLINFWSHHEKMVVIDNKILFMGGIDLCFGRYEAYDYPLKELSKQSTIWYGQDYSNPRIVDFANVANYSLTLINKETEPRMPWRDQAIQVRGPVVSYMTKHFREYWEYANLQNGKKQTVNTVILNKELSQVYQDMQEFQNQYGDHNYDPQSPMFRYQQELNDVQKSLKIQLVDAVQNNQNNMSTGHILQGQKWQSKKELVVPDFKDYKKDYQQSYRDLPLTRDIQKKISSGKVLKSFMQLFKDDEPDVPLGYDTYDHDECQEVKQYDNSFNIQALRSACYWSIGLKQNKEERSIYQAYQHMIINAERYIYIENQFFVSSTYGSPVKNNIADMLAKRVIRAIDNKQPFCVFIFIPLLPGFFGHITEKNGDVLRIQVELHLKTIYQAQNSMIQQIKQHTNNWKAYVKIFGLRNHTEFNGEPKTEMVYIHSKLMIVDDTKMIVGSANINDRSQLGTRDSEIALILEDQNLENNLGKHYYRPVPKSRQIRDYRVNCMKSVFKLNIDYDDILNDDFLQAIEKQSLYNDQFYLRVFNIYPHNSLKTLQDVRQANNKPTDKEYYFQNRQNVIGLAVPWPHEFLEGQKNFIQEHRSLSTQIAPMRIFT